MCVIKDLIALGYGWYNTEGSKRWTQGEFSIFILNENIKSITLIFCCNKVFDFYSLDFSLDNWISSKKVELADGNNSIEIKFDYTKEIKFKCSSFIPAKILKSDDFRTLGLQFEKIVINRDNISTEFPINKISLMSDLINDSKKEYEVNDSIKYVTLKDGWHEVEENKWRWSNGNGELLINIPDYKSIKIKVFSRKGNLLKLVINDSTEDILKLTSGFSELELFYKNIKKLNLITESFCPKFSMENSTDERVLGIQLCGVSVILESEIIDIPIKNIFFDHDVPQLLNFIKKFDFKNKNIKSIGIFNDIILHKLEDNKNGKINLNDQLVFFSHRSGWSFAINSLLKFHNKNGIKFEGFLERPFIWRKNQLMECGELPFKKQWVGVLHNPWKFPLEDKEWVTAEGIVKSDIFQESLKTCKGIFTLSVDLMNFAKKEINVPVNFLYHPTEFVENVFSMEKFKNNKNKKILEVGSWLRKTNSIFLLKSDRVVWNKVRIMPSMLNFQKLKMLTKLEREKLNLEITQEMQDSVKYIPPLSDEDYDMFLSENVVFTDLYASSANNVVIECLARATPILINPLPSIVEYLGKEYPFYFNNMEEASEKINDIDLIKTSHLFLLNNPIRNFIKKEHFVNEFENSEIYRNL